MPIIVKGYLKNTPKCPDKILGPGPEIPQKILYSQQKNIAFLLYNPRQISENAAKHSSRLLLCLKSQISQY